MPPKKEERRRGKKRKNNGGETKSNDGRGSDAFFVDHSGQRKGEQGKEEGESNATPSWMVEQPIGSSSSSSYAQIEAQAPFGLVDVDLKAYLRTAHLKLQELMETATEEGRAVSQDDEVKVMRNAMLDEIKGKELMLATDMDTSLILEDMIRSFSERQTRIMADSLMVDQSLLKLSCHRFGSHLLQSTLISLQSAVSEEEREKGIRRKVRGGDGQVLRSAQELVENLTEELRPHVSVMLSDRFATHVLRTLLMLLSGQSSAAMGNVGRSKKSRSFNEKQQPAHTAKEEPATKPRAPPSFTDLLSSLLSSLQEGLEADRVKHLATDAVAGPTLALVVELSLVHVQERDQGDSILDAILDGLITSDAAERSDYVESLIKDSVGSHLLQRLLQLVSDNVIARFWEVYIKGRLAKLGTHPIANFVIAALVRRLGEDGEEEGDAFAQACKEVEMAGEGLIKNQRIGILIALADRARILSHNHVVESVPANGLKKKKVKSVWTDVGEQSRAARAILCAFGFRQEDEAESEDEQGLLVKVLLSGKTKKGFRKEMKRAKEAASKERKTANEVLEEVQEEDIEGKGKAEELLVSMQGSLLCQSLLRLREPGNTPLLDSIISLPSLMPLASDRTAVHVLLRPLQIESDCSFAQRTSFSAKILSQLSSILCDKFGSRLIDCLFERSDAFYKEKVMRKCLEVEKAVLSSNYGRYFLKSVNMSLFRKDVGQWKKWVKEREAAVKSSILAAAEEDNAPSERQSKRRKVDDELDNILAGM